MPGEVAGRQKVFGNCSAAIDRIPQVFEGTSLLVLVLFVLALPCTKSAKPAAVLCFPDRELVALLQMVPEHGLESRTVRMPGSEIISTGRIALQRYIVAKV